MKKKLIIFPALFCLLLLLTGCSKSSTEVEDDYIFYYIIIANYSSFDVTELVISMVGIEDLQQISVLAAGEISQRFEFQLPEPSGDTPFSYGDYIGSYLQTGIGNNIFIPHPETNILVHINDDGYTVEDVGN
jgi:hypothetical protein